MKGASPARDLTISADEEEALIIRPKRTLRKKSRRSSKWSEVSLKPKPERSLREIPRGKG